MTTESILDTVKEMCDVAIDDPSFDDVLVMYINSAFSTLHQLGVGPKKPLIIKDNATSWIAFTEDEDRIEDAKVYVGLKVKILFDTTIVSSILDSYKEMIREKEWRLLVVTETTEKE